MSSSDSFSEQPAPEPFDHADVPPLPSGSPLDRPRMDDGSVADRPLSESWAAPAELRYDRDDRAHAPPENPLADWGILGTIVWWFIRPGKPHPQFWWACGWLVGFVVFSQFIGGAIGAIFGLIFLLVTRQPIELSQLMCPTFLVAELFSILFGWLALRVIAGRAWRRKVALRLPSFLHLVLVLLAVPAFILLGQWADEFAKVVDALIRAHLFDYTALLPDLDEMTSMFGHWPLWLGVLIIGFGPGIGEELFCRGFLGRGLVGTHGVILGVLLTSVLFGIMHGVPRQVIYASVMGVFLHTVYLTTRSLLMPMLVHTLNNSFGVLAAWADKSQQMPEWMRAVDQGSNHPSFLLVYAGAAVLMAAVVIGLYLSRARLVGADGGPPLWKPAYPGVEYPPPQSGTVVSRPLGLGLAALGIGLVGFLIFVACCFACYAVS
jgi:membrane protease YdiL (CAAX protease family)